ncbi:HAD family hydrolase [Candidatus Bathyarchaeota archaeon]|nr:HAD family hydrolase [Candidatus Bathyarchaeota archaeon]
MIKTVLLDYDGTLHDADSVLRDGLDGIMGLRGDEIYHIYLHEIHRGIVHRYYPERHDDLMFHCRLIFRHLNRPFEAHTASLFCRRFMEAEERGWRDPIYFDDVLPALEMMKGDGLRLYLSTGRDAERKAEALERYACKKIFEGVFSEPSIGHLKSKPEYYLEVLKSSGSKAEETVSIGDSPMTDIGPANSIGITTIWVNRRGEPQPSREELKPTYETRNLLEAARLIQAINEGSL